MLGFQGIGVTYFEALWIMSLYALSLLPFRPIPRRAKRTQPRVIRDFQSDNKKREPMTLCHESEEVHTSDFNTM